MAIVGGFVAAPAHHTEQAMSLPNRPRCPSPRLLALLATLALGCVGSALAADPHNETPPTKKITEAASAPVAELKPLIAKPATAKQVGESVREALAAGDARKKQLTVAVGGKEGKQLTLPAAGGHGAEGEKPTATSASTRAAAPRVSSQGQYERARAIAHGVQAPADKKAAPGAAAGHGGEVHWDYQGENGPQNWGTLKPEFATCATGKRQSPINIETNATLQGPAEPLQLSYQPSSGSVVNNGHTIQVDVYGDNTMTVRGSTYKLLQFHFHFPSEERVNYKSYAMVAHLVHRNNEGQLAVLGVLLDPGTANALINKVWTYMPLDSGDRVRMPEGILNLNELLPSDQRYYQFMGSLTTPPCSEGVLWMVLKQPVPISKEQLKLFGQLFPNNARPVQPLNGRAVRDAQ